MPSRLTHSVLFACLLSLPLLNGCKKEQQRAEPVSQEEIQKKQDKIIADLKQKYPPKEETESSAPPAAVPIEESREAATHSGGLGLDLAAFEITHGKMKECGAISPSPLFLCPPEQTEAQIARIALSNFSSRGFIKNINVRFETRDLATQREQALTLIPRDSELIKTYSPDRLENESVDRANLPVHVYRSEWLSKRFIEQEWKQAQVEPGVFHIYYNQDSVSIDLGY